MINIFSAEDKASILVEALPYIREFYGKTVVIKYGGNAMVSEDLKEKIMQDISLMKYVGIRPVMIHGGGPGITGFLNRLGKQSEFISGLRVTDEETVDIVEMVLAGKINSELVTRLNQLGIRAVGLSGKDANLVRAQKKFATVYQNHSEEKVDVGFVGEVVEVNSKIIDDLLNQNYVPIIAPIGVDSEGKSYNINADDFASAIAGALHAEKFLLLTDTEGVYKNFEDKTSFISTLTVSEAKSYIKEGIISGGMIPKIEACLHAIDSGTNKTHIIDGRVPHSIILEMFTSQGIGTQVVKD